MTCSTVGFTSPTSAGSLLVLAGWTTCSGTTASNQNFSNPSTAGITWTFGAQGTNGGTTFAPSAFFAYAQNAPSIGTSVGTKLVVTNSGFGSATCTYAAEFSLFEFGGMALTSVLDHTSSSSGSTTVTGAIVNSQTDMNFFVYTGSPSGSNLAAGSGFTLGINAVVSTVGQTEYELNVPAGTVTAAFVGSNTRWAGVGASFKGGATAAAAVTTTQGFLLM